MPGIALKQHAWHAKPWGSSLCLSLEAPMLTTEEIRAILEAANWWGVEWGRADVGL